MEHKTKKQNQSEQPNRPQKPKPPYPYIEEEVSFENKAAGIVLSGTLTLPHKTGVFPAVVLVAGYGPNDRNVTGMGHEYFLVLADYLTRQGIAVLRFDKRGVGKSTGDWTIATSEELAQDVMAGIAYLKAQKAIDSNHIGLIGLSEGGLIAAMVTVQSQDVAFAILMAPAVAMKIDDVLHHAALQLRADGASEAFIERDRVTRSRVYAIIKEEADQTHAQQMVRQAIEEYLIHSSESQKLEAEKLPFAFTAAKMDGIIKMLTSPAYRFFLTYNPLPMLQKITVPVLALTGDRDWIISADRVFPILKQGFEKGKSQDYALIELPSLNHMFQTCTTGALMEYGTLEETMSPMALQVMSDWIKEHIVV